MKVELETECGHDAIDMKLIDVEPINNTFTLYIYCCEICGNVEKVKQHHEPIYDDYYL